MIFFHLYARIISVVAPRSVTVANMEVQTVVISTLAE